MILGGWVAQQKCGCSVSCGPSECNIYEAEPMGTNIVDATNWSGSQFLTGDTGRIITSIQLRTPDWTQLPNYSTFASYTSLRLYGNDTANGGQPDIAGGVLHTFTDPTDFTGDVTFTSIGYTVAANTYYWVVLSGFGNWEYTDHNPCIPGTDPYCQLRWVDMSASGGVIAPPGVGNPYAFRVFGDEI